MHTPQLAAATVLLLSPHVHTVTRKGTGTLQHTSSWGSRWLDFCC